MKLIASALRDATHFPWTEVPAELASTVTSATGFVQPGSSNLSFQVLLAQWNARKAPTKDTCRTLLKGYRGRQAFPVVVVLIGSSGSTYCYGPGEDGIVEGPFGEPQIARILGAAMSQTNAALARSLVVHYFDSLHTSAMPGITNSGLFASYYLRTSAPQRPDFESAKSIAPVLIEERGEALIRALGYHSRWEGSTAMILADQHDANRAVAVLLERTESFAESSSRFLTSPVASGLAFAQSREIPWLIALRGSQIRLYSAKATEGVGRKGQSETYLEIDLAVVEDRYSPLLPLIFSSEALAPSGSTEQLLRESARYAVGLGQRLRGRVYEDAMPRLSVAVAKALQGKGTLLDQPGLDLAYATTLRILFRFLFQAYGEDRGLLPYAKNDVYDRHAIKTIAQELLYHPQDIGQMDESDSYWQELALAWQVIDKGDHTWGVPAYNGGLFSSADVEGRALAQISIANATLLPCLRSLLIDASEDGTPGPVDFRSLSVREFGTIYEGLLESSLSLAEVDLTLDTDGTWKPAASGNHIEVRTGEPYFHNASGARKATGSYFTPSFLVDHLIEQSLVPALDAHLARIAELIAKGDEPEAAQRFFDFRICDLAMGSGHFLISAIDHTEAKMSAFLETHPIAQVTHELLALQRVAAESLGELAGDAEIEPASLLRRQIARRCIYGLDVNKIAVELARVAIWIHTFVPGLAMSSLEHGLAHGNSLTGIGTIDEALIELDPPRKGGRSDIPSLFRDEIEDALAEAADLLRDAATVAEATASDVAKAANVTREARTKAEPTKVLFDAAVAMRLGALRREIGTDPDALRRQAGTSEIEEIIDQLQPAHMPYLFPEVFLRNNGGFDVLVGNPPFQTQLRTRSALDNLELLAIRTAFGSAAKGSFDTASVFLLRCFQLSRPHGGFIALVQPLSLLASKQARYVRATITNGATLKSIWLGTDSVFDAKVSTCAPVLHRGTPSSTIARRYLNKDLTELPPIEWRIAPLSEEPDNWGYLGTGLSGGPSIHISGTETIARLCVATADFRDQYYGLTNYVVDAPLGDASNMPALITTRLIDPFKSYWGISTTKYNKRHFLRPSVDLATMKLDNSPLVRWADTRLVPKLLIATQGKVMEVLPDVKGTMLPMVPIITVQTDEQYYWCVAAIIASPPITKYAIDHYFGTALSSNAIKLSAGQILSLPLPTDFTKCHEAGKLAELLSTTESPSMELLREFAKASTEAFGIVNEELVDWWLSRIHHPKGKMI